MFNVTRLGDLADSDGSVPVEVTYADGARPHDVPGVDVDSASARAAGSDRTVARGSYSAVDAAGGSWRGVTNVSLPGVDASDPEPAADGYELRTLAVNIRDRHGDSTDCAKSISVLNLDDSSLFNVLDFCAVDGRTKLSVPDGNYAVISESFQSEPYVPGRAGRRDPAAAGSGRGFRGADAADRSDLSSLSPGGSAAVAPPRPATTPRATGHQRFRGTLRVRGGATVPLPGHRRCLRIGGVGHPRGSGGIWPHELRGGLWHYSCRLRRVHGEMALTARAWEASLAIIMWSPVVGRRVFDHLGDEPTSSSS